MAPGTRVTGNLPAELTSFVGRRGELAEVRRLLADSRLVTLTGIGGVGKTRLALRAAAGLRRAFRDGAWLVQLDQLRDEGLVAQAVAGALGLQDRAGYAPPAAFLHSICTQLDSTVWARLRVLGRGTDAGLASPRTRSAGRLATKAQPEHPGRAYLRDLAQWATAADACRHRPVAVADAKPARTCRRVVPQRCLPGPGWWQTQMA